MKKLLLFFVLIVTFIPVYSQIERKNFNRVRTFDVQHYIIRTSFNFDTKTVYGETTVSFKPLQNGFKTLELDSVGLIYKSVKLDSSNQELKYRAEFDKVVVTLDKEYSSNDLVSVRFTYSAQPQKGIYFVEAERQGRKLIHDRQIWTQGETEEAHYWFPSYDFPDDKATTEQYITVAEDETAIANGELVETIPNEHGMKTFHYKMPVPHSVYLLSFVVGKYVKITDKYKNIPLGFYVYPGKESIVPKAYGKTKDMMRVYEELTGIDFQFNKYDQTIVSNFNFGGMENITATTMADSEIFFAELPFGQNLVEDLVSHELAHSWFGDLVTCRNWAELWLNESFATFMEAAYREKMYGREDYLRKIDEDATQYFAEEVKKRDKHGLFNQLARADDSIFDATTYQKGGAVIHTLRETIGDEAFWKAINIYLNRHKFENVETQDLQKAMEEASKQDLDWFFNQWVYGIEYPKLEITQSFTPANGVLKLTVKQTQQINKLTPEAFILPMDVEIRTARGVKKEKITINKRLQTFSIKVGSKPLQVNFDKDKKIPLKTIKQI